MVAIGPGPGPKNVWARRNDGYDVVVPYAIWKHRLSQGGLMARKTAAQIKAEAEASTAPVETASLNDALFKLQGVMPTFQTDEVNPHLKNKYLSINTLMPKLLVVLRSHGLLLIQSVSHIDGAPALHTTLTHVATGETIGDYAPLSLDKSTPQGQGSAITYMRRYALVAMLGLVIEKDDDGHVASTQFRSEPDTPFVNSSGSETAAAPQAAGFGQPTAFGQPQAFGA